MATLISGGKMMAIDPAGVGSWAGDLDGPANEPDLCHACGIGVKLKAVGFLRCDDTRYGVCSRHRRRRLVSGMPVDEFVAYARVGPAAVMTRAADVRAGMTLLVPRFEGQDPILQDITRVGRPRAGVRRLYFGGPAYRDVSIGDEFPRAFSRVKT